MIQFCYKLGKYCVSIPLVYRWYTRFNEGNDSLDDEKRSGRPLSLRTNAHIQFVQDAVY